MHKILKSTVKCALFAGSLAFLASCQKAGHETGVKTLNSRLANAAEKSFRVHLFQFTSEGYEPYKDTMSSVDVGVLEKKTDAGTECELLAPTTPKAKAAPWAPVDIYTNAVNEAEKQKEVARVGEKDMFFVGDDNNRNGIKAQAYDWTLVPSTMLTNSMDHEDRKTDKTSTNVLFRFTRKGILLEKRINFVVKPVNGNCVASALICDKACAGNDWKRLNKVVVHVDVKGGLKDKFKPPASDKDRNDIAKVQILMSNLDKDGQPTGDTQEVIEKK